MENNNEFRNAATQEYINISEYCEANYWAKKFGVSIEQLKSAIRAVGNNSVDVVEKKLKANGLNKLNRVYHNEHL